MKQQLPQQQQRQLYFASFGSHRIWDFLRVSERLGLSLTEIEHGPNYTTMGFVTTEDVAKEVYDAGFHVSEQ